jgi:hypothetical protein
MKLASPALLLLFSGLVIGSIVTAERCQREYAARCRMCNLLDTRVVPFQHPSASQLPSPYCPRPRKRRKSICWFAIATGRACALFHYSPWYIATHRDDLV